MASSKSATKASTSVCKESKTRLEAARKDPIARFHKALPHNAEGLVNEKKYTTFVDGLLKLNASGNPALLSSIKFPAGNRLWVNPLAGWAIDPELSDPCFHTMPAPPAVDTVDEAAEMIELYWMALLRDVPFADWGNNDEIAEAADYLSEVPFFINRAGDVNAAPIGANQYVTIPLDPSKLFRGGELFAGDQLRERVGPYISQFLLQEISFGTLRISQRQIYAKEGVDYMTDAASWLDVQNGSNEDPMQNLVGVDDPSARRHIITLRDLATYVHFDQLYQAYINAALILVDGPYKRDPGNPYGNTPCDTYGTGTPLQPSDKSKSLLKNQEGFGTFGGPHVLSLVTEVATRALKAVWREKWTHLRLRPEAYGGLIELGPKAFQPSIEAQELLDGSESIKRVMSRFGTKFLPMAFPEGSPTHPAYGAGHATVAGACVTVLKAFFDESMQINSPVVPTQDGSGLKPYQGRDWTKLTVGLELDKLASNISIGRDAAGVHWRSDYTQSILLGQRVAVDMLFHQSRDYVEEYSFGFTTFGGGTVKISAKGVWYTPASTAPKPTLILDGGKLLGNPPQRLPRSSDPTVVAALLKIV